MSGRRGAWTGMIALIAVFLLGIFGGRVDLWSSSTKPPAQLQRGLPTPLSSTSAHAASGEAESLQTSFTRIAQDVGPAVVSISTEQIEQVRQYFRVHPFFGEEPFDEFFRQFYGDAPQREFKRFGLGSGVIIDQRGFIMTNEHVVADASKITVTLADGREFEGAVKGKDPRTDLAVVKIDAKGNLPAATLGDSNTVKTGQWAVALGNPFGLMGVGPSARSTGAEPTLTVGVISALNRQLPRVSRYDRDYSGLIQTDAAINPGNSGGPLLNLQGEIIGINVAILTSSRGFEGIGFAIPINKAKNILSTLIEGKRVVYGWLGIQIQDITPDVAEYYKLSEREGVLVYQVLPDGPASRAGMKDGDIVKSFDGQPILHSRDLIDRVSAAKVGQHAKVETLREGARQSLEIEIGERPSEGEAEGKASTEAWRGLQVKNLSSETTERLNLAPGTTGVVVTDVAEGSPAEQAGLQPGDVINEVNRQRIENVGDYQRVVTLVQGAALIRTSRGYVVVKGE